jgi:flavin-binding protein dodecin
MRVTLPTITGTGDPSVDAAIEEIVANVIAARNWSITGNCEYTETPGGHTLLVKGGEAGTFSAVVTEEIGAAPDANTEGYGMAVIRVRDSDGALTDGDEVKVWNTFDVAIPVGTRIKIGKEGTDYGLLGSDCITPEV